MERYFEGNALYGDDFSAAQIAEWYADEKDGYANLGAKDAASYRYIYHAWNTFHVYRYLPPGQFSHVLGFGSAYGDELLPVIDRIEAITILDPSAAFQRDHVHGVPSTYMKPSSEGTIDFPSNTFDLITCFGVLHHIPNVSFVFGELFRTLKPGACLALREPIVSMGDWRKLRHGLTKRERGIPLHFIWELLQKYDLETIRFSLCDFPLTRHLFRPFRHDVFNSQVATWVDAKLAAAFRWNLRYHARNNLERIRPTSAFFLLCKPE